MTPDQAAAIVDKAASEIERLRAVNAQLVAACKAIVAVNDGHQECETAGDRVLLWRAAFDQLKAAIAAAEGGAL
jgi:hypothetical protein